ncbi:ATP-binding protein [Thermomonospora umbrina]|uniref:AAA ATPase-like protein n=1 Tax=Thermomonospora umbrina TaxID=111806 RepID=A0A3D9SV49_9ACTN|nr:AAA family ATPase [Thermomonospora umbrina]REE96444.1 AAA ATPase-like protein [Thermomonospora umbrina]
MTRASPPLIGREHAAGVLRAEVARAADSHGGLVLVAGEAGIGKTTLVADTVVEARHLGALVLNGSCWESGGAPGHWPWVQVVRGLRRACTAEEWAAIEETAGGALAALLGESARGQPGSEPDEPFVIYDAVTSALVSVAQRRPLLVVLDDLHWADTASVRLLEFVAQHTWYERLLLVGTYRDVEVEWAEHPLRPLISSLVAKATVVTLTGLGREEVGELMTRTVGRRPDDPLVAEIHRRTGGNPFFVEQTARLWHGGGPVSAIAPGVRDAVQRRLSLLPGAVTRLLTAAAVLGREFHRGLLAAVVREPVPHVDRILDQAVVARLAVALGAGRFAFAHDLVRETLYDALDEVRRRDLHAAVVHALERSPDDPAEHLLPAELARHAYLGRDVLDPALVVERLTAAARDAGSRLAVEESLGHRRRAWEVAASLDPAQRAPLALDLGNQLHHFGRADEAWAMYETAAELGRASGHPMVLTRVALTLHSRGCGREGRVTDSRDLLAEAHRALLGDLPDPPDPAGGGARHDRLAKGLALHAAGLARRSGDDDALVFALWTLHDLIWGPGSATERLRLMDEIAELSRRVSDEETEHMAVSLRWVTLLERGDARYLEAFRDFRAVVESSALPRAGLFSTVDTSIVDALQGRFAESESLLEEIVAIDHTGDFGGMLHHLRWVLLMLRGRRDELDELHRRRRDREAFHGRLLEAITAVQYDDLGTALAHLEQFTAAGRPVAGIYGSLWLRFRAQVAAATRDPELCAAVRAEITPVADEWAVSVYGCDISGPFSLWLAMVDAAQERWDEAIAGFTAARESAERLRARPWSLEARTGLAQTLLARGAPGDAEAAAPLLTEVCHEAGELGMTHLVERARRARQEFRAPERSAPAPSSRANEFRFDGEVWSLAYAGRVVHMPDAKGLRDLHLLLAAPGTDVPAVRLANPEGGAEVAAARALGGDPVLDEEAKARYRRRLAELDEEIDRATVLGDDRRAAAHDDERTALLTELRAAAGLAGRTRRLGDEAERARKTVTARIRDTLRRLDRRHPDLAAHLRTSVTTGTTCAYRPQAPTPWRL